VSLAREHLIRLAERRALLQARARAERESLAAVLARTDEAALLLQRARKLVDELRRQPWIVALGVGLLIALRPSRALGWLMRGWSAWRMFRGAQRWWRQFSERYPGAGPA
jgi:hypothetical protein